MFNDKLKLLQHILNFQLLIAMYILKSQSYSIYIGILSCMLFWATACKNAAETTEETATETTETASPETVVLTAEQLKTIGVTIGTIEQKELSAVVKANGVISVLNQNKAVVTAQFGGILKSINVHSGAVVRAGDVIATVTNANFLAAQEEFLMVQAQLNAGDSEASASVANPQFAALQEQYSTSQPQLEMAEKEVKRQRELSAGNAGSGKMLQQAEADLAILKAKRSILQSQMSVFSKNTDVVLRTKRAALQQKLSLMGIKTASLTPETMQTALAIRAPISGRIGEITAKIGAYINESNAITEIIDLNNLHLDLNIYESDLAKFHEKQIINFKILNNPTQTYTAEVHTIGSSLNPTTKTIEVHAHIEGIKTGLIEGMSVVATVGTGKSKTMAVPNAAIVSDAMGSFIFVQQSASAKETVFLKTAVTTGASEGDFTQITPIKPLPENVKIATNQAFFILGKMTNVEE
jgi:membrane fusion protein, heavy metal efflux system